MDLIDINDILLALFLDAVHDLLDAMLKIATILRTRQECSDIELIDTATLQTLGHTSLFNHPCQSPQQCCLPHPRLSDVQTVVLVAPTEHLDGTLQLLFTAYQRVMVLIEVVHTGDESSPGSLRRMHPRLFLQMVIHLTEGDEFADEIPLLTAEGIFQQITGPRIFQMEQSHHQMRHVHRLSTTVEHLFTGIFYQLSELGGALRIVILLCGHRFCIFEFLLYPFCQHLWRIKST